MSIIALMFSKAR